MMQHFPREFYYALEILETSDKCEFSDYSNYVITFIMLLILLYINSKLSLIDGSLEKCPNVLSCLILWTKWLSEFLLICCNVWISKQ